MHLVIGMGKSSACRMVWEAVSNLELSESEVQDLTPQLKALLRMRCTYDPAEIEEAQLQRSFASKNAATERPRPDSLMIAKR